MPSEIYEQWNDSSDSRESTPSRNETVDKSPYSGDESSLPPSDDSITLVPKNDYRSPSLNVSNSILSSPVMIGIANFGSLPPAPVATSSRVTVEDLNRANGTRKRRYADEDDTQQRRKLLGPFSSPDPPRRTSWLRK